jgi:hypothetical protein
MFDTAATAKNKSACTILMNVMLKLVTIQKNVRTQLIGTEPLVVISFVHTVTVQLRKGNSILTTPELLIR